MKILKILMVLLIIPITFMLWVLGVSLLFLGSTFESLSTYISDKIYGE